MADRYILAPHLVAYRDAAQRILAKFKQETSCTKDSPGSLEDDEGADLARADLSSQCQCLP